MRWLRPRTARAVLALALLVAILLAADALCYRLAALPVTVTFQQGHGTLRVGSQVVPLGPMDAPVALQFVPYDPVVHEYQLDDTDSTNNFSLDPAYLHRIAGSPYYRFQAWMRDLDGASRWRDLRVWAGGRLVAESAWPANGARLPLPSAATLRIQLLLQRPETPRALDLLAADGTAVRITLNRNDRRIAVVRGVDGVEQGPLVPARYFPVDPLPFGAMVADWLVRTLLWATLALLVVVAGDAAIALVARTWPRPARGGASREWPAVAGAVARVAGSRRGAAAASAAPQATQVPSAEPGKPGKHQGARGRALAGTRRRWERLTRALHPSALVALGGSLLFVAWIARVQYHAAPHIYDASSYFFGAKIFAAGRLWVPIPRAADRFPGPFMLQYAGRWFSMYPPGTSLALAVGTWLGVPWLVEPVLGTLALLGIGLVAARLYDRRVATLAVLLGVLSPFYSYLAASYMSHTVALFFLSWGFWALVRFAQGEAAWNLPLAAALFGMAGLTRDLNALLFAAIVVAGVALLARRRLRREWRRWLLPAALFAAVGLAFAGIGWAYNDLLTGSPGVSPLRLIAPYSHWGFGVGVGFYGQHTLAAGFVNVDELLTSLAIDLFGWPFYLTLAFLALPFLTRRATEADWLMLAGAAITVGAFVGYYYHGIYLGPRFLLEALPFLLLLTARGVLSPGPSPLRWGGGSVWTGAARGVLSPGPSPLRWGGVSAPAGAAGERGHGSRRAVSPTMAVLVAALIACNLLYFLPRQLAVHANFTGLPVDDRVDLVAVYHPPVHHAIVVTDDYQLYGDMLFPLNDPFLRGDVIYALASDSTDYAELRAAYPGRALYLLDVAPNGSVAYIPLPG